MIFTRTFFLNILFMLLVACGGGSSGSGGGGGGGGGSGSSSSSGSNETPIAIASADKTSLKEGEVTYLDASGSQDQDSKELTYSWSYTYAEKKVNLEGVRPLFVAPEVGVQGDTVKIELTVSDNNSTSSTELVLNINNIQVNSHTHALLKACLPEYPYNTYEENSKGSRLSNVKELNCSLDFPDILSQASLNELKKFENLESLSFKYYNFSQEDGGVIEFESFPELSAPEKLVSLDLGHIKFKESSFFSQIKNLQKLALYKIHPLPELSTLKNLNKLTLEEVKPDNTFTLTHSNQLTNLSISNTKIPDTFRLPQTEKLESIILYKVESTHDFHEIQNLYALKELTIYQTHIVNQLNLANLIELTDLEIVEDNLEQIHGIANLTKLVNLKIYSDKLPSLFGLSNKTNLKTLKILATKFTEFPDISGLINLEELYIGGNEITFQKLPNFSSLVNLKDLLLSRLKTDSFPDISKLPSLENALFFYHRVMDISPLLMKPLSTKAKITLELECSDDINTRYDIPAWLKLYVDDINWKFNTPEGACEYN